MPAEVQVWAPSPTTLSQVRRQEGSLDERGLLPPPLQRPVGEAPLVYSTEQEGRKTGHLLSLWLCHRKRCLGQGTQAKLLLPTGPGSLAPPPEKPPSQKNSRGPSPAGDGGRGPRTGCERGGGYAGMVQRRQWGGRPRQALHTLSSAGRTPLGRLPSFSTCKVPLGCKGGGWECTWRGLKPPLPSRTSSPCSIQAFQVLYGSGKGP